MNPTYDPLQSLPPPHLAAQRLSWSLGLARNLSRAQSALISAVISKSSTAQGTSNFFTLLLSIHLTSKSIHLSIGPWVINSTTVMTQSKQIEVQFLPRWTRYHLSTAGGGFLVVQHPIPRLFLSLQPIPNMLKKPIITATTNGNWMVNNGYNCLFMA